MRQVGRSSWLRLAQLVATGGIAAAVVVPGCGSNGGSGSGGPPDGSVPPDGAFTDAPLDSTTDGSSGGEDSMADVILPSADGGCPPGYTLCGSLEGYCANFQTDSSNCGSCKRACDPGNTCVEGQCQFVIDSSSGSGSGSSGGDASSGSSSGGDSGDDSSSGSSSGGDSGSGDSSSSSSGGDSGDDGSLDSGGSDGPLDSGDDGSSSSGSGSGSGSGGSSSGGRDGGGDGCVTCR